MLRNTRVPNKTTLTLKSVNSSILLFGVNVKKISLKGGLYR